MKPVAVLGAGSWGSALAIHLAANGRGVKLWGHDPEQVSLLRGERCNTKYLPGVALPELLDPLADLERVITESGDVLVVVPSHAFGETLHRIAPLLRPEQRLIWATKGIHQGNGKLLHEIVAEVLPEVAASAVISGPTFAKEVAIGLPTAVTVASNDDAFADVVAHYFHVAQFRAYTSRDVVGVEFGGAVKNVLAIAAGIADGLGFGANTRAALITRGLHEITQLGVKLGGQPETFVGLAGLGDLVLTCTDNQSRNRRLGLALGEGRSYAQAVEEIGQVVEGFATAKEVMRLVEREGVEMPICEQVYHVLYEGRPAQEAVHALLGRALKAEQ